MYDADVEEVVDATDRARLQDCKEELHKLLQEEARLYIDARNQPLTGICV
jgi:hypothetical protein